MVVVPEDLRDRLSQYGQGHVLARWDRLSESEKAALLEQVCSLDLAQLQRLYDARTESYVVPERARIAPVPVARLDPQDVATRLCGEASLRAGEIAVLIVAGGQGSRLGFEAPKGFFPIGPVSQRSLFQVHVEKVLALGRRYGKLLPLLIMTSPATYDATEAYFKENRNFGVSADQLHLFCQGTMPALDLKTGQLLMEGPGRLFTSPNGHGGTLTALADSGLLDRLCTEGIKHVFYLQVDNPLVKIADPLFLGHHLLADAEASSKIVPKEGPADKLGNFVLIDGRCSMIEYSDLPEDMARETDENGRLRFWAGSPAIHIFSTQFLARVTQGRLRIPFHVARKKVPHLNENGELVKPQSENALKFEMFIFDVLPLAQRWTVVETSRSEEFVPLKNATGPDSPATVRQALTDQAASWLEHAGIRIPRTPDGHGAFPLEITALLALDADELAAKLMGKKLEIRGPLQLNADVDFGRAF
jgi:UDP-N-acetylglucosamine/UDP-N-acetylgalactosamine diphosphorylase